MTDGTLAYQTQMFQSVREETKKWTRKIFMCITFGYTMMVLNKSDGHLAAFNHCDFVVEGNIQGHETLYIQMSCVKIITLL